MRPVIILLFSMMLALPLRAADTLQDVIDRLAAIPAASGHVVYKVYLPSSPDPVEHRIDVVSRAVRGDTLCPVQYLLDWTLTTPTGESHAFAAYFDGNFYRYSNNRLNEYHAASDAGSLGTSQRPGVQLSTQFAELAPAILARRMADMANDSTMAYKVKTSADGKRIIVTGVQRTSGYDGMEYEYTFDAVTGMPLEFDLVYNPASISEQTVSAQFDWDKQPRQLTLSEDMLIAKYPDIFSRFRTSNFRINNLVGEPVPTFTAPRLQGERYHHVRGGDFAVPTLLVFLSADSGDAARVISDVRQAMSTSTVATDVIYIFDTNNAESVSYITGPAHTGETILLNGRTASRDMGVTITPAIVFCSPSGGVIADLQLGYNKNMSSIVNQKIILTSTRQY